MALIFDQLGNYKLMKKRRNNQTLSTIAGLWRTLTVAQQDSWITGAVNYPAVNKFGVAYTPSGYQVFVTLNTQLLILNAAPAVTCPVPVSIYPQIPYVFTQTTPTDLSVSWGFPAPPDTGIRIEATQPMSAGNQPKNSFFKLIDQFFDTASSPRVIAPMYFAVYGSYPVGSTIYFRITYYSRFTGVAGVPTVFKVIIV